MFIYLPALKAKNGDTVDFVFNEDLSDSFDEFCEGDHLQLEIGARYTENKVIISGTITASIKSTCSRCLKQFDNHIKNEFQEIFTIESALDQTWSKEELASQTANFLTISGDYFYLDEYIRQLIIIAQDYNPLCIPDCKGICSGCGVDLNYSSCLCDDNSEETTDIRLLKLKEFLSDS